MKIIYCITGRAGAGVRTVCKTFMNRGLHIAQIYTTCPDIVHNTYPEFYKYVEPDKTHELGNIVMSHYMFGDFYLSTCEDIIRSDACLIDIESLPRVEEAIMNNSPTECRMIIVYVTAEDAVRKERYKRCTDHPEYGFSNCCEKESQVLTSEFFSRFSADYTINGNSEKSSVIFQTNLILDDIILSNSISTDSRAEHFKDYYHVLRGGATEEQQVVFQDFAKVLKCSTQPTKEDIDKFLSGKVDALSLKEMGCFS